MWSLFTEISQLHETTTFRYNQVNADISIEDIHIMYIYLCVCV